MPTTLVGIITPLVLQNLFRTLLLFVTKAHPMGKFLLKAARPNTLTYAVVVVGGAALLPLSSHVITISRTAVLAIILLTAEEQALAGQILTSATMPFSATAGGGHAAVQQVLYLIALTIRSIVAFLTRHITGAEAATSASRTTLMSVGAVVGNVIIQAMFQHVIMGSLSAAQAAIQTTVEGTTYAGRRAGCAINQ